MTRRAPTQALAGALLLGGVMWMVGWRPVSTAFHAVDPGAGLVAAVVALPTTTACAWRWRAVARRLDVRLSWTAAVAAYYRSTFLNLVLPFGVLGDVHRGLRHSGSHVNRIRGLRAVVWERTTGQAVQVLLAALALLALGSEQDELRGTGLLALGGCGVVVLVVFGVPRLPRPLAALRDEIRSVVLAAAAWPVIITATLLATAGHVTTFVLAARLAGVNAPVGTLLPLALVTLVGAALPASVAGWGPREGVAAGLFAAAGLGAAQGLTTAALYGILVVTAYLPGALVLLNDLRTHRSEPTPTLTRRPEVSRG